jgi:hypothetical protein
LELKLRQFAIKNKPKIFFQKSRPISNGTQRGISIWRMDSGVISCCYRARMVHFSASWERLWSKQAQRLGGSDLMAVTHFFGATKPVSSPMPKV